MKIWSQSHYGSIKIDEHYKTIVPNYGLNPTMVRLKLINLGLDNLDLYRLNPTMVRLKCSA